MEPCPKAHGASVSGNCQEEEIVGPAAFPEGLDLKILVFLLFLDIQKPLLATAL